jgi:hypothetical protein
VPTDDGGSAVSSPRRRVRELLRPVGRSRWGMAACLAMALGAILAVAAAVDRGETGSAVALGFVLTAVPSLPQAWRQAVDVMAIRAVAVLLGAGAAVLAGDHPVALGVVTVTAAVVGAFASRVGPTAGLAVVLVAVDVAHVAGAQRPVTALLSYAAGAALVVVAWTVWFAGSRVVRSAGREPPGTARSDQSVPGDAGGHAVRVGVAVGVAVLLAGLVPDDLVGGHWLVTSVLLTVQPTAADTGMRLAQRLSGNAVGALIAAVLLGARPGLVVIAAATVVLFTLAMALRPVNYTWWAVTGPPVLLVISEYPALFPWYEGGVRLLMNLAGAAIVVGVVFGPLVLGRFTSRDRLPREGSVG